MSNLIITVIAIVLTAVLVISGLYFGGDIFNPAKSQADAGKMLEAGNQIVAALNMYKLDNAEFPAAIEDLEPFYLQQIPDGTWLIGNDIVYSQIPGNSEQAYNACKEARTVAGLESDDCYPSTLNGSGVGVGTNGATSCGTADSKGPFECDQATTLGPLDSTDPCCVDLGCDTSGDSCTD